MDAFKLEFLEDTERILNKDVQVCVQTDEGTEFFNKSLLQLLKNNGVKLFTTSMNRGHAFMAEQKIRELKKENDKVEIFKLKSIHRQTLKNN